MASPKSLPPPLRKLKAYKTRTQADIMRELKRARKEVRGAIALAAAKAKTATSANERELLFAEIELKYKALADGIDAQIRDLSGHAAKAGHQAALGDIPAPRTTAYDPERTLRYFRTVHPTNSKNLAAVFTEQMSEKTITTLRNSVVEAFRRGSVLGLTSNELQKELRDRWDSLAADEDDHRFVDRAGRRWENARYMQMLVETTAQRVAIESSIDTFAANGYELAQITDDGDEDCAVCSAWEGRIIQIAGKSKKFPTYEEARAAGMFHPNCRHRPMPVDSLIDADEIKRQEAIGKPKAEQMADPEFMQSQRDRIDEGRYLADGMTEDDAKRAVTADRLERAILNGTFSEDAAKAARMLTPGQLDQIINRGVPKFEQARNDEQPGARRAGRILTPRDPDASDILHVLGFGDSDDGEPFAPPPPKDPKPPKRPPFPDSPESIKVIRGLGGSTGAELVEDEYGQRFVRKSGGKAGGDPAEHVRSEAQADIAYQTLGVRVPDCRLYDTDGGPVKLSKYIPDAVSLDEYLRKADQAARDRVLAEIRADFDVDVAFGNWDVVGASRDNILIDKDGHPWRIDNGGAFGWRAEGKRKGADWTKWPDELTTMPQNEINNGVFDGETMSLTVIRGLGRNWDAAAEIVPQRDRAVFKGRVKEMRELGRRAKSIQDCGYTPDYNEAVTVHSYALSKEGFRESVPKKVIEGEYGAFRSTTRKPTAGSVGPGGMPADWQDIIINAAKNINHHAAAGSTPNASKVAAATALKPSLEKLAKQGTVNADYWVSVVQAIDKASKSKGTPAPQVEARPIGDKRTDPNVSLTGHIHDYIKRIGGDPAQVIMWQDHQASNSWKDASCLRKAVQELARPVPDSTWVKPSATATHDKWVKKLQDKAFRDKALKTFAAYDAAVQLALENCEFAHRDGAAGTVSVIRTEDITGLKSNYGLSNKDVGKAVTYKRGACESHSVYRWTTVHGDWGTVTKIPFPLVKGMYFFERTPGMRDDCFLGDGENEFTCDTRGYAVYTVGTVVRGSELDLTKYLESDKLLTQRG